MANLRQHGPYIWVTTVTKLLTGEASCEWSAWFKAHHDRQSWQQAPSTFDSVRWNMDHTELLRRVRDTWVNEGYQVFVEKQNTFHAEGRVATVGGQPDLIAVKDESATIIDVKTG